LDVIKPEITLVSNANTEK